MVALTPSISDVLELEKHPPKSEAEANFRLTCFLAAQGDDRETIAKKLGILVEVVDTFLSSSRGSTMMLRMQSALFPDPKVRIKRLANTALDTQVRLMLTSKDEKIRAAVSQNLLDRAEGKATQVIENRNLNVNLNDAVALDRAIVGQQERLAKLEEMAKKLDSSSKKVLLKAKKPENKVIVVE